jgi:acyl-CoA thioesterase FadM
MDSQPPLRYVTASLHVDYIRPTPINGELVVRARVKELQGRKATISCSLFAGGEETARGEVVVVQMPEKWLADV